MKSRMWILVAGCIFIAACHQSGKEEPVATAKADVLDSAAEWIKAENILEGARYLSDDALEGRGTGTEGERKAAEWIAGQFETMGLKPLGEHFFQKVDLVGFRKNSETSTLKLLGDSGEIAYENDVNLTYWSTSQKEAVALEDAPLLFVGYGVEAPEHNWDDFKGADCRGRILVFLNNDPQVETDPAMFGGEARTYYGRYTYKFEQAMRKGAAGAIMIHTDQP